MLFLELRSGKARQGKARLGLLLRCEMSKAPKGGASGRCDFVAASRKTDRQYSSCIFWLRSRNLKYGLEAVRAKVIEMTVRSRTISSTLGWEKISFQSLAPVGLGVSRLYGYSVIGVPRY